MKYRVDGHKDGCHFLRQPFPKIELKPISMHSSAVQPTSPSSFPKGAFFPQA
jgi:hypothetical protein